MEISDRYRLGRLLTTSAFTELYEGIQGRGPYERRVAIKKLRSDVSEEGLEQRFVDEGRVATQLAHPNIVTILDVGTIDGAPCQVMELVEGLDLSELLRRAGPGEIPKPSSLYVALEVAHALAHAHDARDARGQHLGLVHRDVTPSNILIGWNGAVKLADFGIALFAGRAAVTQVGHALGKTSYMAPEQAVGGAVDRRSDLYALACVLHEMLCGYSPLTDEPTRLLVNAGADLPISSALDTDLAAMLSRATRHPIERRYGSADEFAEVLGRALAGRLTQDPRSLLKSWVAGFRPSPPLDPIPGLGFELGVSPERRPRTAVIVREQATEVVEAPTPIHTSVDVFTQVTAPGTVPDPPAPPGAPTRTVLTPRKRSKRLSVAAVVLLPLAGAAGLAVGLARARTSDSPGLPAAPRASVPFAAPREAELPKAVGLPRAESNPKEVSSPPRSSRRSGPSEPSPGDGPNLEQAAARRGLRRDDLEALPQIAALMARAASASDPSAKAEAQRAAVAAIDAVLIDRDLISAKLGRLEARLRARRKRPHDAGRLLELEDAFLSARVDAADVAHRGRLEELCLRLYRLEAAIDQLR